MVQSAQFDNYRPRVVVPLVRAAAIGKVSFTGFNPTFKIRGTSVVLHPLGIVSIPVDQLGEMVGLLSDDSQLIIAALDELLRALGSNSCAMCGLPISIVRSRRR